MTLSFGVAADLASVEGRERVTFTPDRPITELVFRLTANSGSTVAAGNRIDVQSASVDQGGARATYTAAGAAPSTAGGLLHLTLRRPVPAGTAVTAELSFRVTLGRGSFDRFGRTGSGSQAYAWFASAHPLLAWQRGVGWHTEPLTDLPAETATSEAMHTDLTVTAPAADTVIMSGDPGRSVQSGTTRRWQASLDSARDVSVAVGPFRVQDVTVGPTRLRLAAPDESQLQQLGPEFERAVTSLAARFGPYPFPSLSVARLPGVGGGIEYPSSILLLDSSRRVIVHETAHQWFYALVGDSQALHPWLDEAFASYAEQLVDNDPPPAGTLDEPGPVDRPVAAYGTNAAGYFEITYDKGAAALHAARAAAGPAAFDAAIRCYVNANADRIATPGDLTAALRNLPAALAVLRKAGALS